MDVYLFSLCLSFGGLLLMALLGFGHHHAGHGHGHVRGGRFPVHKSSGRAHGGVRPTTAMMFLGFFSPRVFFSVLLGFGATGLIVRSVAVWSPLWLAVFAVIGGLAFERFVFQPFWNLLFGFASRPARMLDTTVAEEGAAATDFDAAGQGIVALELDGQVRQVLGTLPPAERVPSLGRVRTGDRLVVRAVDHRRNTCTVSRAGC